MHAETYLRCRLEDALLAGQGVRAFRHRVRAALAIGAIDEQAAIAVLDDAVRAFRFRPEDGEHGGHGHRGADGPTDPSPRVVVRPTLISRPWGTVFVSHVVLGPHETTFSVQGRLTGPRRRGHRGDMPWEEIDALDAAGTRHRLHFSGGSSGDSFHGEYHLHPALDVDTATVTVGGVAIDLTGSAEPPVMRIATTQTLTTSERAARHLDLLAGDRYRHVEQDDRTIAAATFTDLGQDVDVRSAGARPGSAPPGAHPRSRSRKQRAGRWLAVGATLPELDGLSLTLTALSDDGSLGFVGTLSGPFVDDGGWPVLRFAASDDVGNRYSFGIGNSSWSDQSFNGTLSMTPAVAGDATVLTVEVDLLRHHVEIAVPIMWQEAP